MNEVVFGNKIYKETTMAIRIRKEGKYLYLDKPHADEDKEYRMDLTTGMFDRVNHYKTTGTKITPVRVRNITRWFTDCCMYCEDPKFAKVILFSKHHIDNKRYSSAVRFVQGIGHQKARRYESWVSLGINITDIEKRIEQNEKTGHWSYNYRYIHTYMNIVPSDFSKPYRKYIQRMGDITTDMISTLHSMDQKGTNIDLIQTLREKSNTPQYREYFSATRRAYDRGYDREHPENNIYNIFDFANNDGSQYKVDRIIDCITEYNLDVDAFLAFCLRMYNVEGLDMDDLFGSGNHYKDYLNMEKNLKNGSMAKMDKYPQNFMTTFHIVKREYRVRKEEFDENNFRNQCDRFRHLEHQYKKYSIVVPQHSSEIENEADCLKHCVRIYIPRVIEGKTLICFLRDNEQLEEPLVTIEVKDNHITQAYGIHDSKPTDEQLDVMRRWARQHDLKLSWSWD